MSQHYNISRNDQDLFAHVVIGLWQRILIMVILTVRLFLLQLKERCLIGMKV